MAGMKTTTSIVDEYVLVSNQLLLLRRILRLLGKLCLWILCLRLLRLWVLLLLTKLRLKLLLLLVSHRLLWHIWLSRDIGLLHIWLPISHWLLRWGLTIPQRLLLGRWLHISHRLLNRWLRVSHLLLLLRLLLHLLRSTPHWDSANSRLGYVYSWGIRRIIKSELLIISGCRVLLNNSLTVVWTRSSRMFT